MVQSVEMHTRGRQGHIFPALSIQSTPIISRQLGAKIRERELSGSPVIARFRAKAQTRDCRITIPHFDVCLS